MLDQKNNTKDNSIKQASANRAAVEVFIFSHADKLTL